MDQVPFHVHFVQPAGPHGRRHDGRHPPHRPARLAHSRRYSHVAAVRAHCRPPSGTPGALLSSCVSAKSAKKSNSAAIQVFLYGVLVMLRKEQGVTLHAVAE